MAAPLWAARGVWTIVVVLAAIGVAAAIGRMTFPTDMIQRFEPMRTQVMTDWEREDPLALQRPAEIARMDRPFAEHPYLTLLHVLPGALFFVFAPLQFSKRIRTRHPRLHRWSGRILLPLITVSLLPGLFFGIVMPFGGRAEAVAIVAIGITFLHAMASAFLAIRRGDVARHREWMIRMFAIALGISMVRVVGGPIDFFLTPFGVPPADLFVLSVWSGWLLMVGGAEIWIRYTRPPVAQFARVRQVS
jgi:uncharacterized membrane protein